MNPDGSSSHQRQLVPSTKFSTQGFNPREQFDAWCSFAQGMCELRTSKAPSEGFTASTEMYQFGPLLMSNYAFDPLRLDYSKKSIRQSRLDHWCLGVVTGGKVMVDSNLRGFKATTGDLALYSYAMPFAGELEGASYSSLFFSRDDFWDIADELDRGSQLCSAGPMSQIVADFLLALKDRAGELTIMDATAVTGAFGALVRAMVRQTPETLEAAKAPISAARFGRVRRFILKNLKSPDLTPDTICARLGLSRRSLYYLFEKHGGVATFIRCRRLAACYNAIASSSERRLISSVAYEYGYTNMAVFSRQFRQRYGLNPSEVRSAHLGGQIGPNATGGTFIDWLTNTDTT